MDDRAFGLARLIGFVLADADRGRSSESLLIQIAVEVAATVGGTFLVRRRISLMIDRPLILPLLLIVMLLSPLWEPFQRWFFQTGRPFETMVMNSQKALMLATAVFGYRLAYQRLSVIIGVALTIFCAAISSEYRVQWLIAIYGFAVVSWMIASHWDTLRSRLIAGETRHLPLRWLIIGPSIPLLMLLASADQHGTYPLPEAQLDRFAMKLSVGYPAAADEVRMLQDAIGSSQSGSDDEPVLSIDQLTRIQQSVAAMSVAPNVQNYMVRLAQETPRHASVALGLSPRGLLTWQRVAQGRAWLSERTFVTPDDVQDVAEPVLSVRFGLEPTESRSLIQEIVPGPVLANPTAHKLLCPNAAGSMFELALEKSADAWRSHKATSAVAFPRRQWTFFYRS